MVTLNDVAVDSFRVLKRTPPSVKERVVGGALGTVRYGVFNNTYGRTGHEAPEGGQRYVVLFL